MRIETLSTFPDMFEGPMSTSIMGRARAAGILDFVAHDLRNWTHDRHRTTDDEIYGGGAGLLMKPEPIFEALDELLACGEDGDVIDFVGGLFGLRPIDAARKLAQDFGVPVDDTSPPPKEPVQKKYRNWRDDLTRDFAVLCDYIALLDDWLADYAPKSGEAVPHPNFIEACRLRDPLCHIRDTVLSGTPEEQQEAWRIFRILQF